jgi:hypothetical protein
MSDTEGDRDNGAGRHDPEARLPPEHGRPPIHFQFFLPPPRRQNFVEVAASSFLKKPATVDFGMALPDLTSAAGWTTQIALSCAALTEFMWWLQETSGLYPWNWPEGSIATLLQRSLYIREVPQMDSKHLSNIVETTSRVFLHRELRECPSIPALRRAVSGNLPGKNMCPASLEGVEWRKKLTDLSIVHLRTICVFVTIAATIHPVGYFRTPMGSHVVGGDKVRILTVYCVLDVRWLVIMVGGSVTRL